MNDNIGNRMKSYERIETDRKFDQNLPLYARIDGRGFSKFTKNMERPYDFRMSRSMIDTTKILVQKTHASIGYVQSDEISLGWNLNSSSWFDGKIMKMTSVLAGLATSAFIQSLIKNFNDASLIDKLPHFDTRIINMPDISELTNMFVWRSQDCTKNSISMAAHYYYSHKDLQNKNGNEKKEMLLAKGIDFDKDYPYYFIKGTWVKKEIVTRLLTIQELNDIPEKHRPDPFKEVVRTNIIEFDLPPLGKISNKIDVLFNNEKPILQ